jgi:flagella basal body P-ring formation protein FlgA
MSRFVFCAAVLCSGLVHLPMADAQDIQIELKASPKLTTVSPCLGDIATVKCTDPQTRASLEALPMPHVPQGTDSVTFSQRQISSRLLFAGYSTKEYTLKGPPSLTAKYVEVKAVTDADIEKAALKAVSELMNLESGDLRVSLRSPVVQGLGESLKQMTEPRVEVQPQRNGLGLVPMQVQIWDGGDLKKTVPVTCEVRRRYHVAKAVVSLTRDQPVTVQQVSFETQYLDKPVDQLTSDQLVGRSVRFGVPAGSVIQMKDIKTSVTGGQIIIKKGTFVSATVRAGRLRVSLRDAEALQDGAMGESIRLRNRQTGETIVGEVIGHGRVLVHTFMSSENAQEFR